MRAVIYSVLISLILTGCKISYSFNGADICEQCETVSVDLFELNTASANPQLSQILTEALRDKFNNETRLALVTQNADLSFTGNINVYDIKTLNIQGNETAASSRLTIGINVQYYNQYEPEKNFDKNFTRFADFDASQNFNSVEFELIDQIKEQLIQDIFNNSVVNW